MTTNELRVFISSTFRDLTAEREHLMKHVFPELRALCRNRGVTFTEVDLRWGLTEEDQALGQVIRTCLEEVDKCRPYFLGIIGNRYGWVPEFHEILMDPDLLQRFPWVEQAAIDGASVTEMEFIHGVFASQAVDGESAYFYRRHSDEALADEPARLAGLIARAQATGRPFHEFDRVEELGALVHEDLRRVIDRYWPVAEAPSPLEIERRSHAAFAASRIRGYIPIAEHQREFDNWLAARATPLVIVGESGLGKSALVAHLIESCRRRHPNAFIIRHFVGASESDGRAVAVMRHIIEEIRERFQVDDPVPARAEEVERSFSAWLFRAEHLAESDATPIFVAIDAVNQLSVNDRQMRWLPSTVPAGIRLIVSTTPVDSRDALQRRGWKTLEVTPIEDERIRQSIVVRYLGEFRKAIAPAHLRSVVTDRKASSPLYLRVVAEELRLHGSFETIGDIVSGYTDAADLTEVLVRVLERLERDYGEAAVRDVLSAIWTSRAGLTEQELIEISGVSRLDLSRLLLALDYHLLHRDGLLGFFHEYLRTAAGKRYFGFEPGVAEEAVTAPERESRTRLAEYFARQPVTVRSAHESMWQAQRLGDMERLRVQLGRVPVLTALDTGETRYDFLRAWKQLTDAGVDAERTCRDGLEEYRRTAPDDASLQAALMHAASLLHALGKWGSAVECYNDVIRLAEASGDLRSLARAENELGALRSMQHESEDALRHLERARVLFESLDERVLAARAVGNLGNVFEHRGEYDRALESFTAMRDACRRLGNRNWESMAVSNIGLIHKHRAEYDEALACFHERLAVTEERGDRTGIARAAGNIATVHLNRGEFQLALQWLERTRTIFEELGDRHGLGGAYEIMGVAYKNLGDFERGISCQQQRLALAREIGDRGGAAIALGNIGFAYADCDEPSRAVEFLVQAIAESRAAEHRDALVRCLPELGILVLEASLQHDAPPDMLLPITLDIGHDSAGWRLAARRYARAVAEEGVALAREMGAPEPVFEGTVLLARLDAADGEKDRSMQRLGEMRSFMQGYDSAQAELQYWEWKIGGDDLHRVEALARFESLAQRSPKSSYHKRVAELSRPLPNRGA